MARRVTGPTPGAEFWFTPAALGNDTAPEDQRVRVLLRYPTEADKRRADKAAASTSFSFGKDGKLKTNEDGSYSISVNDADAEEAKRHLLDAHVVEVEGYDGASGAPIKTGGELFEHGETEIVDDVVLELRLGLALRADEKKRSAGSQDSQSTELSNSDGIASSADALGSMKGADITEQESSP